MSLHYLLDIRIDLYIFCSRFDPFPSGCRGATTEEEEEMRLLILMARHAKSTPRNKLLWLCSTLKNDWFGHLFCLSPRFFFPVYQLPAARSLPWKLNSGDAHSTPQHSIIAASFLHFLAEVLGLEFLGPPAAMAIVVVVLLMSSCWLKNGAWRLPCDEPYLAKTVASPCFCQIWLAS